MNISRFLRRLSILAILLVLCGCASLPGAGGKRVELTVLHTNDHHGRFWKNNDGEHGLAARKTLVDAIRAEVTADGGVVLLLDAGDINTGVPESDLLNAEPDIRGMNLMGYDAMAVGNHEFDNPLEVLRQQEAWMEFPLLSANVYDASGQRLFTPYHIFSLNGLRVAVFGLTTETTAVVGNPQHIGGLVFRPAVDEAGELVPQLRQKADVVIALTHLGHYPESAAHETAAKGSIALARAVPDIDLIVDGHSHSLLTAPAMENGVPIVQAGDHGKYLGRIDLRYEKGTVSVMGSKLMPINRAEKVEKDGQIVTMPAQNPIPEDPAMLALLTPFQNQGAEALMTVIAHADGNFTGERTLTRSAATELGVLLCRALREKTDADVAVMNGGGIRAGLPAGDITYKDVLKVKPFGNTVCTVAMTGHELTAYLRTVTAMEPGTGAFAHLDGVELVYCGEELTAVLIDGATTDPSATYTLALESYLAGGGDGYPVLNTHPNFLDTRFVDADIVREYLTKHSPLRVADFTPSGTGRQE
jgi:5'-nucleotidase/UDP-sugar diphosphatase